MDHVIPLILDDKAQEGLKKSDLCDFVVDSSVVGLHRDDDKFQNLQPGGPERLDLTSVLSSGFLDISLWDEKNSENLTLVPLR